MQGVIKLEREGDREIGFMHGLDSMIFSVKTQTAF